MSDGFGLWSPAIAGVGADDVMVASLDGSGDLAARDTRFRGKKVTRGTGKYQDDGGNTWQ